MPRRLPPLVVVAALACGGGQPPVTLPPPQAGPTCHVVLQTGPARDTIFVGVADAIDTSHAQHPATEPERLVFGLISPAADQRDCNGLAVSGLALYHAATVTPTRVVAEPANGHGPVVVYRIRPGGDARDLLDQGADVVVTDDPATLDYAARRDGFEVAPLPWSWTYVFAGPAPVAPADVAALSGLLAAGGVHGDVRAVDSLPRWVGMGPCDDILPVSTAPRPASRRIAYPASDAVARDLATRLVALAAQGKLFGGSASIAALPLAGEAYDAALLARNEFGFVAASTRRSFCAPFADIGATPLVDARSHVIVRRGVIGIDVDSDGAPRLVVSQ